MIRHDWKAKVDDYNVSEEKTTDASKQAIVLQSPQTRLTAPVFVKNRNRRLGQAGKSARGMPWHWEPKKGVAIYEKPR